MQSVRGNCSKAGLWTISFLVVLFVGLSFEGVSRAADSQVVPVSSASDTSSPAANSTGSTNGSTGGGSATYTDVHRLGAGLSWTPVEIPPGATTGTSVGYVGVRYWFNRTFGLDGGLGFGFPEINPNTEFLTTLHVEPMVALAETNRTILYGNLDLLPGFVSGTNSSFAFQISAGLGVEHAMEDMPKLALYGQWNPVSLNFYGPPGQETQTGFGFLGSIMNVDFGFRYYF
ncbi:MAG: hypothetical protein ACYCTV_06570 [Leptospirales bacterium]